MLEVRRAFDNHRRDQFIQYLYGVTYEAYMDQLIIGLINLGDNNIDNTDNAQDLNSNQCDTRGTKVLNILSFPHTRHSGIVISTLCQDTNYPEKRVTLPLNLSLFYLLALIGPPLIAILLTNIWR